MRCHQGWMLFSERGGREGCHLPAELASSCGDAPLPSALGCCPQREWPRDRETQLGGRWNRRAFKSIGLIFPDTITKKHWVWHLSHFSCIKIQSQDYFCCFRTLPGAPGTCPSVTDPESWQRVCSFPREPCAHTHSQHEGDGWHGQCLGSLCPA